MNAGRDARARLQGGIERRIVSREDRRCRESGIGRPGIADREGGDRHTRWHLHDRQQRVETIQRLRLHRDTEYGEGRFGGDHAGKVSGTAGTRNDDVEPTSLGSGGVFEQQIGRAMSGNDAHFVGHAELLEDRGSGAHRFPIRARTHDDADERLHRRILAQIL